MIGRASFSQGCLEDSEGHGMSRKTVDEELIQLFQVQSPPNTRLFVNIQIDEGRTVDYKGIVQAENDIKVWRMQKGNSR